MRAVSADASVRTGGDRVEGRNILAQYPRLDHIASFRVNAFKRSDRNNWRAIDGRWSAVENESGHGLVSSTLVYEHARGSARMGATSDYSTLFYRGQAFSLQNRQSRAPNSHEIGNEENGVRHRGELATRQYCHSNTKVYKIRY